MKNYLFSKKTFILIALPLFIFAAYFFASGRVVYAQECTGQFGATNTYDVGTYTSCPTGSCGTMWCKTGTMTCMTLGAGGYGSNGQCETYTDCGFAGGSYSGGGGGCDTSTCVPPGSNGMCSGGVSAGSGGSCGDTFCNNGETSSTCSVDCPIPTDFNVVLSPNTRTVYNNGEYGYYTVEVAPIPWQSGQTYTVSFNTCPVGVTCELVGGNVTSATYSEESWDGSTTNYYGAYKQVKLTPTKATPPGTYTFSVRTTKNTVSKDVTGWLIVTAPNASCSSISVPSSVSPGQSFNATVTMYNNGSTAWTNGAYGAARHGAFTYPRPGAAATWGTGSYYNIPQTNYYDTTSVYPGYSYTFTIPSVAPTTAGYYNYSTQMYRDGATESDDFFFGAVCNGGTITVGTPSPPTVAMTAPTSSTIGAPFTVSWTSTGASSVLIGSSVMPPAGCTLNSALTTTDINSSRTVTCSTTGSKYFQITVQNPGGVQAVTGKTVTIGEMPPPTNPVSSCPAPGNLGSVSWTLPAGYTQALLRVYDTASDAACSAGPNQLCTGPYTGSSYSFNGSSAPAMVVGHTYGWWVHTYDSVTGQYSNAVGGSFTCAASTPNLTASAPTQSSATAGVPLTFTSSIINNGSVSTGAAFSNFFQVATAANGGGTITDLTSTSMSALAAGVSGTATSPSYTFGSGGTYSVRACADKSNSASAGTITESNESDNCSGWTTVTVTTPTPIAITSFSPYFTSITDYPTTNNNSVYWTTTGSPTSCVASGASPWGNGAGTTAVNASIASGSHYQGVYPSVGTYTYTLRCSKAGVSDATATFSVVVSAITTYTLTTTKTIGGTITTTDGQISCGGTCTRQYNQGSSVTLQAVPDTSYWRFVGWGGACSGQGTGNCTITINGNTSVTAQFRPKSLLYQEF